VTKSRIDGKERNGEDLDVKKIGNATGAMKCIRSEQQDRMQSM